MTRTYVVGDVPDELREYHRLVQGGARPRVAAVEARRERPRALRRSPCDLFAEHGYPTQLTKKPGEVLDNGFFHGLGHGVGLEVHERPWLGRVGDDLVAGDVITLEPGLYRAGLRRRPPRGHRRSSPRTAPRLTDYPYDLEP